MWENAERFEDEREGVGDLLGIVNMALFSTQYVERLTSNKFLHLKASLPTKMAATIGAPTTDPSTLQIPSFQAFSRSLVRAYTLVMRKTMYSDEEM